MRPYMIFVVICLAAGLTTVGKSQTEVTLNRLQRVMSLTPNLPSGEHLYTQYCSSCHEGSGWGSGPQKVPTLAGQHDLYLLEQLIQFSVQGRVNEKMHAIVSQSELANPQTLRDVTAYIAQRPGNPKPDTGDGRRLQEGQRVYQRSCLTCHAEDGSGSKEDLIPAIGGQQYDYLLIRLRNFSRDHTPNVEPVVLEVLASLTPEQLQAVADYTSRLPALRAK